MKTIHSLLARFGMWLVKRYGEWPSDALVQRAAVLAKQWVDRPDLSGEYKRHQVYARMIKEHPGTSRRAISIAIEHGLEWL